MDTVRYIAAVLLVISIPPAIVYWLVAHPLARFRRRLSPWVTYSVLAVVFLLTLAVLIVFRRPLVGADLGFHPLLFVPALVLYGLAIVVELNCRKYLTFKVLIGWPELAPERMESKLLDEGIYGRIRHPRYLGFTLGCLGWAVFASHVGSYLMAGLTIPSLYLVTLLEERELLERFGAQYAEYIARVPRVIPRLSVGTHPRP
jgi:protein-S-isoprenylcysteine O-methyltransferase Ste14